MQNPQRTSPAPTNLGSQGDKRATKPPNTSSTDTTAAPVKRTISPRFLPTSEGPHESVPGRSPWRPGYASTCASPSATSLAPITNQLWEDLLNEPVIHVDETGWKEGGYRRWLWSGRGQRTRCEAWVPTSFGGLVMTDGYTADSAIPLGNTPSAGYTFYGKCGMRGGCIAISAMVPCSSRLRISFGVRVGARHSGG